MTETLTASEVAQYTGLKQSAAQSRWLNESGITHRRRRDGTVAVTWTQVNNSNVRVSMEPNWNAA